MADNLTLPRRCQSLSEKLTVAAKESTNEEGIPNWDFVLETLRKEELNLISYDEFWRFLVSFAQLVAKHDCRHTTFIAEVLELAFEHYTKNSIVFFLSGHLMSRVNTNSRFISQFLTPYKKTSNLEGYEIDAVTTLAMQGQLRPLELLLRFGAIPIFPKDEEWELGNCFRFVYCLFQSKINCSHSEQIKESLLMLFNETSRRRLFLVFRCLHVLYNLRTENSSKSKNALAASLRLYFKALPEPFVTSKEILHKLKRLLPGLVTEEEIEAVAKDYENYFLESCEPPGPRSLKHLSRFQVRETLRTSSFALRLPQGIDSLPVPKLIKEYISLREKDTDLHPLELTPIHSNFTSLQEE